MPKDDDDDSKNLRVGMGVAERQVLQDHQKLHNKKWMKWIVDLITFVAIRLAFLLTILGKKILELLLEKIMKSLLINKLDKGKELSKLPKGIVNKKRPSIVLDLSILHP